MKLRDGHGRQEEQIHQNLNVAQDWQQGGIKDEHVAAFVRCCCWPPSGAAASYLSDHLREMPLPATILFAASLACLMVRHLHGL
jgi:hypothetical protein